MNIYDQVNSLSDDDLLLLCRVLTCAPGDEMKIYHSRLGGTGHQNAKEGSMIQRGRETAPDESAHHREAAVGSPAHQRRGNAADNFKDRKVVDSVC